MKMTFSKISVVFLTIVAAANVSLTEQEMAGHYYLQGVMEVGSELLLKPDGTFEYMLAYGAADYFAKGTWKQDGKSVILLSDGEEEPPFRLTKSDVGKPGRIRVWVMGKNGKGVPNIHVGLKAGEKHLEATTNSDGAAVFPDNAKPEAVYFEVRVYSLQAGPFPVDPANRDFYFEINGDAIMQVLFKDEPLVIDGNALIMRHWDPDKPMRYVKE